MVSQGLVLMAAGMGTVCVFLSIMVLVMQGTGRLFQRYAHVFEEPEPVERETQPVSDESLRILAAGLAAIAAKRRG